MEWWSLELRSLSKEKLLKSTLWYVLQLAMHVLLNPKAPSPHVWQLHSRLSHQIPPKCFHDTSAKVYAAQGKVVTSARPLKYLFTTIKTPGELKTSGKRIVLLLISVQNIPRKESSALQTFAKSVLSKRENRNTAQRPKCCKKESSSAIPPTHQAHQISTCKKCAQKCAQGGKAHSNMLIHVNIHGS